MTQRVGAKGQVVIPKELWDRAGLGPGASVDFDIVEDGIVIRRASLPTSLRGRFTESGMAFRLLDGRRNEPR